MELPVYSILVVVTLLSPIVNGGLIGNSSTNQPEVTYGQHVGNDSNADTDTCKAKCGDDYEKSEITCKDDPNDNTAVKCSCKNTEQEFDYSTKKCRGKLCNEECGVKGDVKCSFVTINDEVINVECSCEDPTKTFVAAAKECKEKVCIEECGVEDGVKCGFVTINGIPSVVDCSCEDPTKSFVASVKECRVLEKTACEGEIALKKCRRQSAACVLDETAADGFRCVCGVGYFEKNGVCTEKTACDDAGALEVCRRKSAACVLDATAVEGFRCVCDVGYYKKNGVCSKDDKNQKVIVISPSPDVIVLVLLTIVILLLLGVGFCNIRMNQKFKAAHNSVPGVK